MKRVRCAIYTRKSSEDGLDQSFNSLDAQREACAAYVLSQASEGWTLLPEHYDDGGLSGGTLQRPALQRLLADIAAGLIDIVVVYKVDRLTRSLFDFAKLVDILDEAGTSFVSITQSFNTTTSMGRLTLNMLLSFAQFEREVTAERIRDKIAASKARGMWMGGTPPTGYAKHERTLQIVSEEARFVRDIFARYLALGNVRRLVDDLRERGITCPARTLASGRATGGRPLSRGQLYYLLGNPIYIGRIRHRDKEYPGQHPAILDPATWEAAQRLLAENRQGAERQRSERPSLLAGLVHDEGGQPLATSHTIKGKVRYRYYVTGTARGGGRDPNRPVVRIPARELEDAVVGVIVGTLADPLDLAGRLAMPLDAAALNTLTAGMSELTRRVRAKEPTLLRALVAAVHVRARHIDIDLNAPELARLLGVTPPADALLRASAPIRLTRTGRTMRLIQNDGCSGGAPEPSAKFVKLIVKGRRWWEQLSCGEADIATIAREAGLTASYVTRVTRLAHLSPRIVDAIIRGAQPARLEAGQLTAPGFPASWAEQERLFFAA